MAAIAKTQTTSTDSPAGATSPAAGDKSSTAGKAAATDAQNSESGSALDRALAAELGAAQENPGTGGTGKPAQGKGGTNAAKKKNAETGKPGDAEKQQQGAKSQGETTEGETTEGETTEGETTEGEETEGETTDGETTEGETTEGETTEGEEAGVELPETIDPEKPPKGLEKVPKRVWKRITDQGKQIAELKAQVAEGGITITPTAANPLADVETTDALEQRVNTAKSVRAFVQQNPKATTEGATIPRADGSKIELTAEQVQARLASADSVIEAAPDAKARILQRKQTKPWETAETIMPGLLKKGTEANGFVLGILSDVPEIKAKLPDWEVFLAAAARGYHEVIEEQAGKAKYVRMALDKDGKVVRPEVKAAGAGQQSKPKPKTPGTARPALTATGQTKQNAKEVLAALPKTATQEERLAAAMEAEMGAAA